MKRWPRPASAMRIPRKWHWDFSGPFSGLSNRRRALAIPAVAVLLLVFLGSWQVVYRGLGVGILAQSPVQLANVPMQVVVPKTFIAGELNPFDASQIPWSGELSQAMETKPESAPPVGSGEGVIAIPGFSAVITGQGLVRPGQSFHGGQFKRIEGDYYILDGKGGEQRILIPRAPRPTLESFSRVRPAPQEKQ